jgi:hypothetical protein
VGSQFARYEDSGVDTAARRSIVDRQHGMQPDQYLQTNSLEIGQMSFSCFIGGQDFVRAHTFPEVWHRCWCMGMA